MADAKPKSSKRDLWLKFGRFITGVTLACFFLPFFGVSCDGMEVIHMSGADYAGGCKPGGMLTEAGEQEGMGGAQQSEIKVDSVPREPLAIVAFALAIVVVGLSWVRTRGAMIGACAVSVACIGALIGLWIKIGGDLSGEIDKQRKAELAGDKIMKDVKIEAGSRFGLWLTIGGLLGVAALTGLALKENDAPGLPPSTPPPA